MNATNKNRAAFGLKQGLAAALTALCALVAASCGGVGSGGTGDAVHGLSAGTTTGFGSVVVDGLAYADTQVSAMVEAQPNVLTPVTARLGQFTEIEFESGAEQDSARAIRIDAAAVGQVEAVDVAGRAFTVLGQAVVENAVPDAGPVTFYSGTAGLEALVAGDAVEVHGVPRWNALSARYEVLATRIEKLPSLPSMRRLAGVVQNSVGGTGPGFMLGEMQISYTASSTLPFGAVPRDGDRVIVWSDQPASAGGLVATAVRVVARSQPSMETAARLGGTVSRLDSGTSKRFDVAGVAVRYADAVVTPQGPGFALADGEYVLVDGTLATDGVLDARLVRIRKRGAPNYVEVELTGPIENFVDAASFTVRGTPVDAQGVSELQGCGNSALRDGLTVRVEGRVEARATGSVVEADVVRCVN